MLRTTDWYWHITIYLMAVCSSRTLTSWFVPAAKKCVGHEFPFTALGASPSTLSLDLLMLYSPLWSSTDHSSDKETHFRANRNQTELITSGCASLCIPSSRSNRAEGHVERHGATWLTTLRIGKLAIFFFLFFFFLAMPPMWHAGSYPTKCQTCTPELGAQSFNHWTAREVWKLML